MKLRITQCLKLSLCFLFALLMVGFCDDGNYSMAEINEMRIEDLNYFNTNGKGTAYAFSKDHLLTARCTLLEDWSPVQFLISVEDLDHEGIREIETIQASQVHLFSDGDLFYIAAYTKESEESAISTLCIGTLDSKNDYIDWNKEIEMDSQSMGELSDAVLIKQKLLLVFPQHVFEYNVSEKTHQCIYEAENSIENHYFLNHACVFENELILQDNRGNFIALNADDGSFRTLDVRSEIYRPGKYDAELGRYKYYIYGSDLIYAESLGQIKQMVSYNLITGESTVFFDGSFSVYFHDKNGIYIDLIDYGTGKYLFLPDTNELKIIPRQAFKLLEILESFTEAGKQKNDS